MTPATSDQLGAVAADRWSQHRARRYAQAGRFEPGGSGGFRAEGLITKTVLEYA